MADTGIELLNGVTCQAHVGSTVTYAEAMARIMHVPDPFTEIIKKDSGHRVPTVMEFRTSGDTMVSVLGSGFIVCICAMSSDQAYELLEEVAKAITGDVKSMQATFRFTGGRMVYRTGVPVDLGVVATYPQACLPSSLPHFQSIRVGPGRRSVRVFADGVLLVDVGSSVDNMERGLLAACDIVHASDGDTNVE